MRGVQPVRPRLATQLMPQQRQSLLYPVQMSHFSSANESRRRTPSHLNLGVAVLVGQEYAVMLHRFEKFYKQLEPGLRLKIPFIDKVHYVHDLREQVIDIPPQTGVTKDNVAILVDGVLYMQVEDAVKASYNVENYEQAMINLA